jgi:hypothetical protein
MPSRAINPFVRLPPRQSMEVDMSTLAFATGGPLHQTQLVIVNDRLPSTDEHCALCGGRIEKGYVRDSRTRLIYCDKQCFAGGARMALPIVKTCESKMAAGEAP